MENSVVLGVDIGGSHITAAQVHLKKRMIVDGTVTREYVDTKDKSDRILDVWMGVIRKAYLASPMDALRIGIAMPGPFEYQKGVSLMQGQDKFDDLYGLNVRDLLAERLGTAPDDIRFMNDAECFLRGEVFSGAAAGYDKAIGLSLGTGLGSAICDNGSCRDANLWCSPFKEGIAEDYLSTRWFIRRYGQLTGNKAQDVKELADLYENDRAARDVFREFGVNLGAFLSAFIQSSHAEVVVIGGNIAKAFSLFSNPLIKEIAAHGITVPIEPASLGEEAALIGAASCWQLQAAIFNHS